MYLDDNVRQVAAFAEQELERYLTLMSCQEKAIAFRKGVALTVEGNAPDDEIWIEVRSGKGSIRGSNGRSLLFAVYRFLREAGCRFIKPGRDGEYIPASDPMDAVVRLHEKASHPCRGISIEGANSLENILDLIDFLPKLSMNSYFIQFKIPFTFFDKWYRHVDNPYLPACPVTVEDTGDFEILIRREIARRDLELHAVGHGWTSEVLGKQGYGWDASRYPELSEEVKPLAAQVGGKRGLFNNISLDTNLCYSNPLAADRLVDDICTYALDNPDIDFLHVWLADHFNNFCECEQCIRKRPSDQYISLLNRVDEALTKAGNSVRICFLAYFDLLWPPLTERLANPKRFVLLFAPITRTYQRAFLSEELVKPVACPPFSYNRLSFPETPAEHLSFLREWRKSFGGEAVLFDYHYMWYSFFDLGESQISRVLSEDIGQLQGFGFSGMISCQTNRSGMPSGLGLRVLARKLWNKNEDFHELAAEYYAEAYGDLADEVSLFLEKLSILCYPPMLREGLTPTAEHAKGFAMILELASKFERLALAKMSEHTGVFQRMWKLLNFTCKLAKGLAYLYLHHAAGDREAVLAQWYRVKAFVQLTECDVQQDFDAALFINAFERALGLRSQFD